MVKATSLGVGARQIKGTFTLLDVLLHNEAQYSYIEETLCVEVFDREPGGNRRQWENNEAPTAPTEFFEKMEMAICNKETN